MADAPSIFLREFGLIRSINLWQKEGKVFQTGKEQKISGEAKSPNVKVGTEFAIMPRDYRN